jgi:L-amino acid N-acyltransferase YncA
MRARGLARVTLTSSTRDRWRRSPRRRCSVGSPALMLRHADATIDGEACAAIYAPFVSDSAVSFEEEPPDAAGMTARIRRIESTHPWLIVEIDGVPAGFAYASPHRVRRAYRWAADVSVYVDPRHHRRGLGSMLYGALLALLRRQRLHVACAGITLPNDASVRLHESLGFLPVGVYRSVGWKGGAWRDVGWWQLTLSPPNEGQQLPATETGPGSVPPEPLGPQTLDSL